jgi:hypothetical protein
MPFWRKKTLFISHAYDDEAALGKFKQTKLPKSATARIFPPIKVPPTERVGDDLLDAIRKSDGLVYFKIVSLNSFWVVFEINYAHQLGLDVFAFDPETGKFHKEERKYSLDPLLSINWNLFVDRDELTASR